MYTNDNYMTSYKAGHRILPTAAFESNISSLNPVKESMPNIPNLKQWNYDTTAKLNYDFKIDTMDPTQRSTRLNVDEADYMMPQWEKYWSNPPKRMSIPLTEYNDKYISSKLMSNINQTQTPTIFVQQKLIAPKEIITMQTLKISDMGIIRKIDPYVSTQKLAYTEINPITVKLLNDKLQKKNKNISSEYKPFYSPIFNQKKTIRFIPNAINYVPHNSLKTEMSASYKTPNNTLSKFDCTVGIPISVSRNPTLSQILSVPGMYTSEYSKIGKHGLII